MKIIKSILQIKIIIKLILQTIKINKVKINKNFNINLILMKQFLSKVKNKKHFNRKQVLKNQISKESIINNNLTNY